MFDQYDNEERGIDGFYYLDGPRGGPLDSGRGALWNNCISRLSNESKLLES